MGKGRANGRTGAQRGANGGLPDWPAARPEWWELARILPYPNNPRVHPPEEITALAADMLADGVTMPILVDEVGIIIAGHGRRAAAELNGFGRYPVVVARGWTEEQKRSARLRDNQRTLQGLWSPELVKLELTELKLAGYDLQMLGFPELQLRSFGVVLGTEGPDSEETPEPPKKPVSRRGDLWLLGDHRLLCGDATSKSDVAMCLAGAKPHLMVTDPPYGVEYDPNWRNQAKRADGRAIGAAALGKVMNDDEADWSAAWKLFPGDVGYIWHAGRRASETAISLTACGFFLRAQIIWRKNRTIIGRGDYHYNHEPCWYVVRVKKTGHWCGARDQGTIWDIAHDPNNTGHGTQKPIECMKRPIENNSKVGDSVYDPFSGSGTTIIAAEMTKRRCLAIEIDPSYVDVDVLRWQTFTGREATLEATGQTFDQVKAEREKKRGHKRIPLGAARKGSELSQTRVAPPPDA